MKYSIAINVYCTNMCAQLTDFSDIKEKLKTFTEKITKITIRVDIVGENNNSHDNYFILKLSNEISYANSPYEIMYRLSSTDTYTLLSTKLQKLLAGRKLFYSIFSRISFLRTILPVILGFAAGCSLNSKIIYIHFIAEYRIVTILVCILLYLLTFTKPLIKIKRSIFPLTEFRFGVNVNALYIAKYIRCSIIGAILISIIANIITNLL